MIPKNGQESMEKAGKEDIQVLKEQLPFYFFFSLSLSLPFANRIMSQCGLHLTLGKDHQMMWDKSSWFWIVLEGRHTRSLSLEIPVMQVYFKHHSEARSIINE